MNVALLYLLVVLTIRTVTYVCLRLTSYSRMFDWVLIKPAGFYVTYVTDLMILVGTLNFIVSSTPLKEKYQKGQPHLNSESSIFPDLPGSINQESRSPDSEESVDGDALIQAQKRREDSDSD
jgi:hypothetical protein